jgi:L-lactate dehydrogenase complex protein LldG
MTMASRDQILANLRQVRIAKPASMPEALDDKSLFKDYPQDLVAVFGERFKLLFGEIFLEQTYETAAQRLRSLITTSCLMKHHPLCQKMVDLQPELTVYLAERETLALPSPDFAAYDIGVTAADFLVARTGSIVVNARHMGGRRLSVLAPTHIVLALRNQIVPSLEDVLRAYAAAEKDWSYATIITGASRTSDIEKILVLGAHGPKRLILILIEQ